MPPPFYSQEMALVPQHKGDYVGLTACLDLYGEENSPLSMEPWTVQPASSQYPIQAPKNCTVSSHYIYYTEKELKRILFYVILSHYIICWSYLAQNAYG